MLRKSDEDAENGEKRASGVTALMLAAYDGHRDAVRALIMAPRNFISVKDSVRHDVPTPWSAPPNPL